MTLTHRHDTGLPQPVTIKHSPTPRRVKYRPNSHQDFSVIIVERQSNCPGLGGLMIGHSLTGKRIQVHADNVQEGKHTLRGPAPMTWEPATEAEHQAKLPKNLRT